MKDIKNFEQKLLLFLLVIGTALFLGWQRIASRESQSAARDYSQLDLSKDSSDPAPNKKTPNLINEHRDDYRIKVLQTILKQLLESNGYGADYPFPQVRISTAKSKGAYFLAKDKNGLPAIVVEEAAYATAQSFGADSLECLACFLGHELAHYINGDTEHASYMEHQGSDLSREYVTYKREERADLQGAFWSLLVGYDLNPGEPYIERLYQVYNIKQASKNYPELDERKKAIKLAIDKARTSYHTLIAANYALAFKKFDLANELYNQIDTFYHYRGFDLLNNQAMALANQALHLGDRKIQPYTLPFEYQWEGRMHKLGLQEGERSIQIEIEQAQRNLLQKAQHYLSMAVALNPKPNIRLNLLVIKLLLDFKKDKDSLYRELVTAQKKYSGRNREIATFGLGLYHALNKDTVQAKNYWTVSNYHAADLSAKALYNYQLLNNQFDTSVLKGAVQNPPVLELLPSEKLSYTYLQNPSRVVYRYPTKHQIVVFERIFFPANRAPKNGETIIIGQDKLILDSAKREIWKLDHRGKVVEKAIVSVM